MEKKIRHTFTKEQMIKGGKNKSSARAKLASRMNGVKATIKRIENQGGDVRAIRVHKETKDLRGALESIGVKDPTIGISELDTIYSILRAHTIGEIDEINKIENILMMIESLLPEVYKRAQKEGLNKKDLEIVNSILSHLTNLYKLKYGEKKLSVHAHGSYDDIRKIIFEENGSNS